MGSHRMDQLAERAYAEGYLAGWRDALRAARDGATEWKRNQELTRRQRERLIAIRLTRNEEQGVHAERASW